MSESSVAAGIGADGVAASPPPAPPMVQASNVSKAFGDVVAVSDVSFSVGPGVTALLGPNGAGKSTLFRMLCGLTPATSGSVRVLGRETRTDRDIRGRIGLVPQQESVFDRLDALAFVVLAARTHGVTDPVDTARRFLREVELDPDDGRPVTAYSKGMRQRVKLAAALVNNPSVLILDEPLNGLDPVQRRRMIELFHQLADEGRCLLVSSHVLDEVARMGSEVLVIAQGRLVARGDYRDLRDLMDDRPHRIRVVSDHPRRLAAALVADGLVNSVALSGDSLVIDTDDIDRFGRAVAPLASGLGARLDALAPLDDDLESVFRYLVERR
jgi:ABC-2 type transport system ATP-binding protein